MRKESLSELRKVFVSDYESGELGLDGAFAAICAGQHALLDRICDAGRASLWVKDGARDMAGWVAGRLG